MPVTINPIQPNINKSNGQASKSQNVKGLNTTNYSGENKVDKKVKHGVLFSTLVGVGFAMYLTFRSKKMHLDSPIDDYVKNLTHIVYDEKKFEVEKLVTRLGIGSVTGGLVGGLVMDKKENRKAKYRESIIQLVGNIFTPLICVSAGSRNFTKYVEPKIVKMCNLKGKASYIPRIIVSGLLLLGAIFAGNKVGNVINQKIFKVDDERKLKLTDMSPHIDDACLALSLVASNSSKVICRFIPAALSIAGYSVGTAQESSKNIQKFKKLDAEKKSKSKL